VEIKAHLESICKLKIGAASPHQKAPTPEESAECPGKIISNLLTVEVPSIGACYVLAVTDLSKHYHWITPLRLKSDATDQNLSHHLEYVINSPPSHSMY